MSPSRHGRHAIHLVAILAIAACGAATPVASPAPTSGDAQASVASPAPTDANAQASPTSIPASSQPATEGAWIAYQGWGPGGVTHLGLVRPDGSDDHALVIDGLPSDDIAHPDWSADGTKLAFDVWSDSPEYPGQDRVEAWFADADGSHATRLAACELPCLQLAYPRWSADGSRIALIRYDINPDQTWGPAAIEVVDLATGDRRVVSELPDGTTSYYHPRWSPDGESLLVAIETYEDATAAVITGLGLGTVLVDGPEDQQPERLTGGTVLAREADFGPTGGEIAFTRVPSLPPVDEDGDVWIFSIDQGTLRQVTTDGGAQPSWDPAGDRIWFRAADPGTGEATIGSARPNGSEVELLPYGGTPRTHPESRPVP